MPVPLREGDVVTDLDEESMYFEKQGLVVSVQLLFWGDPEITVHFDRWLYPYHLREDEYVDGMFYIIDDSNLFRRDDDWTPTMYADRHFPERWHSAERFNFPVARDQPCMVEGCEHLQTASAWCNCCGTVFNAHVCATHFQKYHRKCGESFPWRKKKSA